MKKLRIVPTMALIAIATITASCKEEAMKPQEAKSYKTLSIENSNTTVNTLYTASIRGEQFVDIRPQISGVITKIAITEGAQITKGQTLFIIDQVPYQAAVDAATAAVASAKSTLATAELNANSGEDLYKENIISKVELQTLQNTLVTSQSALALAEAELTSARNNLSYTVVKSPVNGVAGMINYRTGALVSSSIETPLVSVSNNNNMYAYFSISESALLDLIEQSGSTEKLIEEMGEVTLILNNGSTYAHTGKVDAISGVIDQSTGSVVIRAIFENPEKMLRDGGNGAISVTTKFQDVIVIPKIATFEIQNKTFVYKVIDGKATSAEVALVPSDNGNEFIISSGLNIGDEIIAEGAGLMREGTIVKASK